MTVGVLNSQQLRSIVEEKWESDPKAVAFGLHVSSPWSGPSEVDFSDVIGTAHVLRADSVFQVREALREAETKNDRIIVLTKLQQTDLGQDVVARMARSRLFPIDHVASLCGLFKAKELDRSICEPGIAQALLEFSPKDGYPPVSAGVLDAGTVWRAVCRHVFEMGDREPDQVTLLLWATTANGPQRYIDSTEELRGSLQSRLTGNLGDVADAILRFVDSGAGSDTLALAVTCQVIFGEGTEEVLDAAAARLEQYHENKPISKSIGRMLGSLATEAFADLDKKTDDPKIAQAHLARADELLKQFRCEGYAYRNALTRMSYEQRLARFADQVKTTVEAPTEDAISVCEQLQNQIANHRLAKQRRYADQITRSEMAVRLTRWLNRDIPSSPSFSEAAAAYSKELAFVDWAREAIVRGDDSSELTAAYQLLDAAIAKKQSQCSKAFATGLADWVSVGSKNASILGVEDVLEKVVAKVVEANNRVLMIVLDGMSWAVCHELLEDIRQDHWFESTLDENSVAPPPVIATVPSATMYSRTSLMSGKLCVGDASTERQNFRENAALKQCSDRRYPPVVFHKKGITEGSRGGVSQELRDVILSNGQRVIAVVLNAIDDRLANAAQIRDNWTINRINPLGALLRLARDSGRVVILASDHGHVWHRSDAEYEPSTEGSRWRQDDGKCAEGEIVISGERVLPKDAGGKVIVPWSETIHYKRPHHGYHGGATPQEMVCPLILLRDKSSAYAGLFSCEYPKPDWWSAAPVAAPVEEEPTVTVTVPSGPRTLFDLLPEEKEPVKKPVAVSTDDWIGRLVESQAYKAQKAMIRRHAPEDDVVRSTLEVLSANGGVMTPAAFAKAANMSAARLDGLIARIGRILNVDGYEILSLDRNENKVELNVAKLRRQFDIK